MFLQVLKGDVCRTKMIGKGRPNLSVIAKGRARETPMQSRHLVTFSVIYDLLQ